MFKTNLPTLSQLKWRSIFSFLRVKKVPVQGIFIEKRFESIQISEQNLADYATFIGFKKPNPLCYLYLLAQRAQTQLMLDKKFSLPIPGLIHVGNELNKIVDIDFEQTFDIEANIIVNTSETDYFKPMAKVVFKQNNQVVAFCNSSYLMKKKSAKKTRIKQKLIELKEFNESIPYEFNQSKVLQYAKISGDSNPIHTYNFFAKMMGFPSTIVHGWYMTSKAVEAIEEEIGQEASQIIVQFTAPAEIPNKASIQFEALNQSADFQIVINEKQILKGFLKF